MRRILCALLPEEHPGFVSQQMRLDIEQIRTLRVIWQAIVARLIPHGSLGAIRVVRNRFDNEPRFFSIPKCVRCGEPEW